jgi:RNase H-fold protein (predicted Holliday junction resolvase)
MNPILALDFGRARIGAAISDQLLLLAHPLETIPADGRSDRFGCE